ncbi:unnamed protein product [Effrenium voratum]|uniref:Uncharacterized protein n=1 Tax=Effrenium voratum TaxID=2562239 RepID=A0AA36MSV5_9DINO|nr:unnamed protein product [Effrenium voratum]
MSYSPPGSPIDPRGFAIIVKRIEKGKLAGTATGKAATLDTSVWIFGKSMGLVQLPKDLDDDFSPHYFKYGAKVWSSQEFPYLTFMEAGMKAGGIVEFHSQLPKTGKLQSTTVQPAKSGGLCSCFKGLISKMCSKKGSELSLPLART